MEERNKKPAVTVPRKAPAKKTQKEIDAEIA
jgi:hypothetical protein